MNTLRTLWIEALRSGKYKKTQAMLRSKKRNAFCCLGVLCDVYDPSKWVDPIVEEDMAPDDCVKYITSNNFPPLEVLRSIGLKDDGMYDLCILNNSFHYTFDQIADELENNPERYFDD